MGESFDEVLKRLVDLMAELKAEEKRELLRRLRQEATMSPEVKQLMARLEQLKAEEKQIRRKLAELGVRRKYTYNYRGSPLYNLVKDVLAERKEMTTEELKAYVAEHGYSPNSGSLGVVLRNLEEDGLIHRERGRIRWAG